MVGTLYEEIYLLFRANKIKDIDVLSLPNSEIEKMDLGYLKSARSKFKTCKKMSNYDNDLKQFNEKLTDEEIEILATLMIIEWITPKINATEFLRINMDSKDFRMLSPANQLKQSIELRNSFKREASSLMGSYSFNNLKDKL